jgi:hypothetical protein
VTLRVLDTAVWNGDSAERPVGSSGKVRDVRGRGPSRAAYVDWGGGERGWYRRHELLTMREAAERGIEPCAAAWHGEQAASSAPWS